MPVSSLIASRCYSTGVCSACLHRRRLFATIERQDSLSHYCQPCAETRATANPSGNLGLLNLLTRHKKQSASIRLMTPEENARIAHIVGDVNQMTKPQKDQFLMGLIVERVTGGVLV